MFHVKHVNVFSVSLTYIATNTLSGTPAARAGPVRGIAVALGALQSSSGHFIRFRGTAIGLGAAHGVCRLGVRTRPPAPAPAGALQSASGRRSQSRGSAVVFGASQSRSGRCILWLSPAAGVPDSSSRWDAYNLHARCIQLECKVHTRCMQKSVTVSTRGLRRPFASTADA